MSKNPKLAYEANEPAFLQKLRGQYGNQSGRLERPSARPRKPKDDKDDDDAPVYVDEASNEVLSKEEYQALVQEGAPGEKNDASQDQSTTEGDGKAPHEAESTPKQSNLTEVGGQRKRKQVKVVGEEEKVENPEALEASKTQEIKPKASASRKSKKAKKIKLSFDEE
ncbi:hypothetical protein N7492_010479 [Penicillium capsulatum]|uniref:DUF4604 domain-containing protein n=1 Tax=Penicillium capsulatum TaxID=69766 RepID=A0A9W9LEY9_9EURO|nr:hypothetical protein N7492_010479 [Penicillium capsulatum]KAJ6112981.1 hypothetical protein N7512_008305 [Penicillium capsulatum]